MGIEGESRQTSIFSEEERTYIGRLAEGGHPLQAHIDAFLDALPAGGSETDDPTGLTRDAYLDFAEARLRQFAVGQSKDGAILDPFDGKEHEYVTACFARTGAVLLEAGRCEELTEQFMLAMDWACRCLGDNKVPDDHADFTTFMLMRALGPLSARSDASRSNAWRHDLSRFEPELTYVQTERNFTANIRHIRNWACYAMHGEMLRMRERLTESTAFIDKYMAVQIPRFTREGLYRDPNLPAAYDAAARQQLSGLLDAGYEGEWAELLTSLLDRGMQTMLFMQSSTGAAPMGGRSNQIVWNELTCAYLYEREAARMRKWGDDRWAGVYKRAARLSLRAVQRWINDNDEFRLFKNRYPADTRTGWEFYAYYSTYSLYAAQIAVSCFEEADDSIREGVAPSDAGGFAVHVEPFRRIYATTGRGQGGYHLTIDTNAQMGHDATGWVRLHKAGLPEETALSVGIPGMDGAVPWTFLMPKQSIPYSPQAAAIGPVWRDNTGIWHRLANDGRRRHETFHALDENGEPLSGGKTLWHGRLTDVGSGNGRLAFTVTYTASDLSQHEELDATLPGAHVAETYRRAVADIPGRAGIGGSSEIKETYCCDEDGVVVTWTVSPAAGTELTAVGVTVPLLITNGIDQSVIRSENDVVIMDYHDSRYRISPVTPEGESITTGHEELRLELFPGELPNRNGRYRLAQWTRSGSHPISLRFTLERRSE